MIYIVVDLEMNKISKEYKDIRKICTTEIIECGAVALDAMGNKIDEYKAYVNPEYNDGIVKKIVELTGITTDMVITSGNFEKEMDSFAKWCAHFDEQITFYEWSDSDYLQICNEIKMKGLEIKEEWRLVVDSEWIDLQKSYGNKLGLERSISLKQAVNYAGFDFQGKQHDPLFDADNTAELLILMMDASKFEKHMQIVLDALKPKEEEFKLGDMFDFAGMMLAC